MPVQKMPNTSLNHTSISNTRLAVPAHEIVARQEQRLETAVMTKNIHTVWSGKAGLIGTKISNMADAYTV